MFIVWGKRVSRKKVGYVADFCPMCREAQTFLLKEVRSFSHVYYIPTSGSTLHGYERSCQGCGLTIAGAPKQYVAAPKKPAHVREILARSFPGFDEVYGERLKIEDSLRIAPDSLPPPVRRALIQQPFMVLSPMVEAKFRQTSIDGIGLLSLIAGFAMVGVAGALSGVVPPAYSTAVTVACLTVGAGVIVLGLATSSRRYARSKLVPKIARTLRPLRPSEAEISLVLGELKQKGHKIGRILKPAQVAAALAK